MRQLKLNTQEKEIEEKLLKGEYFDIDNESFTEIAQAISGRKKDAVLNLRVNSQDLKQIKEKTRKLGIGYQTFLSEVIHRLAHN